MKGLRPPGSIRLNDVLRRSLSELRMRLCVVRCLSLRQGDVNWAQRVRGQWWCVMVPSRFALSSEERRGERRSGATACIKWLSITGAACEAAGAARQALGRMGMMACMGQRGEPVKCGAQIRQSCEGLVTNQRVDEMIMCVPLGDN